MELNKLVKLVFTFSFDGIFDLINNCLNYHLNFIFVVQPSPKCDRKCHDRSYALEISHINRYFALKVSSQF